MRKLYILELAAALWLCMAGSVSAEILHMGMRGAAVESLQNDLVEAGYLARTVDGDYGSTTVKAVSEFQKDHGLPVTGKADDSTQAKLKEDDGKGYRDGGGIVYAQGNRGDMIAELQDRLAAAGYLTGASDGIYGSGTAAAVEQFQKDHRLPVSGAVDEQTLSLLGGGETGEAKKENKKEIKKEQKNKKDMHYTKGDRGSEIKTLQNKLRRAGYLDGEADGIYGNDTESAVRALQEEHGLSVTGNVDDATWKLLGGLSAPSAGGGTLKAGDRGKRVVKLQNRLLLHGYNPGGSDGIYGAATAEAVRKLQTEEKLERTGMADTNVWERLENAPKFTGKYKKSFQMKSTAYTPTDGGGSGRTALGNYAGKGHAAVDPDVIPLGSIVYIEGYGYAICDDIGGAIQGYVIDVGVDNLEQAYQWGSRDNITVYLIS